MFSSERVLAQGLGVPKRSGGLHIPPLHGALLYHNGLDRRAVLRSTASLVA